MVGLFTPLTQEHHRVSSTSRPIWHMNVSAL